jgi:hypothetical protein
MFHKAGKNVLDMRYRPPATGSVRMSILINFAIGRLEVGT